MNILLVGFGSIGQRYYKILKSAFDQTFSIDICDKEKKSSSSYNIINNLSTLKKNYYDAAFILTPAKGRYKIIKLLIEMNIKYFFIEKPLSLTIKESNKIGTLLHSNNCYAHISCNLRFHKALKIIKELLNKKKIGKIFYSRATFSHYLPFWRPKQNYRKGYNAEKKLGGDIFIDAIHEPDYLTWLFGDAKVKIFFSKNTKNLLINSDDLSCYVLEHKNGIISEIFVDYLRKDKLRKLEIIGEIGTIIWKSSGKKPEKLEVYIQKQKSIIPIYADTNYDSNDQYTLQISYFISLINKKKLFMNSPKNAIKILSMLIK